MTMTTTQIVQRVRLTAPRRAKFQVIDKRVDANALTLATDLDTIKTERLYEEDFATFEEYVEHKGISVRHAYRLINQAKTQAAIDGPTNGESVTSRSLPPLKEGVARELTGLPPVIVKKALEQAQAATGNGKAPTAKAVKAAVETLVRPSKAKPGQQRRDPRLWVKLESHLGKALRMIDDINRAYPHHNHHFSALGSVKEAMATLREWKKDK